MERLADIPPGPALSAALAAIDVSEVGPEHIVDVLRAQSRQSAHEQARFWVSLVEVGLRRPPEDDDACWGTDPVLRAEGLANWASGEVAAGLTWTSRAADRELDIAETVVRALPDVLAALWAGRIDRGKAVVFAEFLDPALGVTAKQVAAISAKVLPVAPRLTTAQLRARLRRALLAIDPDWARRRYRQSVRSRCVTALLERDGTVTMTAYSLPAEEATAACARVDRLAEETKRAGHRSRVGQIAADVFLGLLDGRFHGLTEDQIVAALVRDPRPEDAPADKTRTEDKPAGGSSTGEVGRHRVRTEDGSHRASEAGAEVGADRGTEADAAHAAEPDTPGPAGGAAPIGIEVRVGLASLLGLDERPAEIAGLGPVLADVARRVAARQLRGAEWRFAVTDPDGYLVLGGITRHRPTTISGTTGSGRSRGGVVELQVSADQLDRLAAAAVTGSLPLGWAGLVSDIAAQFARRDMLLADLDKRPDGRFPSAALARHVQIRDRTCSHPCCRRPARRCELDHTVDHAHGGSTTRKNIGPGCRKHHWFKHRLRWRLSQPEPGVFVWVSPLGQVYRTRGEPILPPLPDPVPGLVEPETSDHYARCEGPTLRVPHKRPAPKPGPRPPPEPAEPADDEPPF